MKSKSIIIATIVVAACIVIMIPVGIMWNNSRVAPNTVNNTQQNTNTVTTDNNTTQINSAPNNAQQITTYQGIKDLDIEIDYYQEDSDIKLDFEQFYNGNIETEYENEWTRTYAYGTEALQYVDQILALGDLKNVSDAEIANKFIEITGAQTGYQKIEVEIQYFDGTIRRFVL